MSQTVIDIEELKAFTGVSSPEDLLFYLMIFRHEMPGILNTIKSSLHSKNRVILNKVIHNAKGAGHSIKAHKLIALATEIESNVMDYSWDELTCKMNSLVKLYAEIQEFINGYIEMNELYNAIDFSTYQIIMLDEIGIFKHIVPKEMHDYGNMNIEYKQSIDEVKHSLCKQHDQKVIIISTCLMPNLQGLHLAKFIRTGHGDIWNETPIMLIIGDQECAVYKHMFDLDICGVLSSKIDGKSLFRQMMRAIDFLHSGESMLIAPNQYAHVHIQDYYNKWFLGECKPSTRSIPFGNKTSLQHIHLQTDLQIIENNN